MSLITRVKRSRIHDDKVNPNGPWTTDQFIYWAPSGKQFAEIEISGHPGGLVFLPTFTKDEQHDLPRLLVAHDDESTNRSILGGSRYWVFRDEVYSTSLHLQSEEVKALVLERENKIKARVAAAVALMKQVEAIETGTREPIPDDAKIFVWRRDAGKCVRCGSNRGLEFDHIIPLAMGGSNTARNLQLLCETCNRAKGGSLV